MSRLKVSLLGAPHIERDGLPVTLDTRKAVALLATWRSPASSSAAKR
jgi:hypothetical protein